MKAFSIRPISVLRPYVERIWGWESQGCEVLDLPTLLPGTGAEVFFHYRKPFLGEISGSDHAFDPAHLICVRRKPIKLYRSGSVGFVAIRFRAGGLHRFTALPGADLIDGTISATDLWGAEGTRLKLDVLNSPSQSSALAIVERFLVSRLGTGNTDALVERAVSEIYKNCSEISVGDLAIRIGITKRELQRRFRALTGQTPVEVRQLSRIQHVMRQLLLDRSSILLESVLKYGFYDQAHFIHAFSSFGLGPPHRYVTLARTKSHFYNTPWNEAAKDVSVKRETESEDVVTVRRTNGEAVVNQQGRGTSAESGGHNSR